MIKNILTLMLLGMFSFAPQIGNGQTSCKSYQTQKCMTSKIQLRTELLNKEEISGDDEISGIKLRLKLNFTTESDETFLVYKGSPLITHYWISKDAESSKAQSFVISTSLTVLTENERSVNDLSLEDFAIISKNKPFETELEIRIFYKKDIIQKGSYVLQINVETWRWKDKDIQDALLKFSSNGKILTYPITSEPMKLKIE